MKKEIKSMGINAKRWFEKVNGNTYYSVEVKVNGEVIGKEPFAYGYGEIYVQTAHQLLQDKGFFPKTGETSKDFYEFRQWLRSNREKVIITCSDVPRKKDL